MLDCIRLAQIKALLAINNIIYLCRLSNPFYEKAQLDSLADNCKAIGVESIDYRKYAKHKRAIALSQLDLLCSSGYITRKFSTFSWERPLPDVKMYMMTHAGCHYYTIANVLARHDESTRFFMPIMPNLVGSKAVEQFIKGTSACDRLETGSSADSRFLLRMIKTCKKNTNAKIIIFIDLPRVTSTTAAYGECRIFNKMGSIINGHIALIKKMKINSCLLSHNTDFHQPDKILCSNIFEYDAPDLFARITAKMEEHIRISPINWKYLDELEFLFHNYPQSHSD